VEDLRAGELRLGLGVHMLKGHHGIYALEWAPDGRACA
jgi:hypothetical protein